MSIVTSGYSKSLARRHAELRRRPSYSIICWDGIGSVSRCSWLSIEWPAAMESIGSIAMHDWRSYSLQSKVAEVSRLTPMSLADTFAQLPYHQLHTTIATIVPSCHPILILTLPSISAALVFVDVFASVVVAAASHYKKEDALENYDPEVRPCRMDLIVLKSKTHLHLFHLIAPSKMVLENNTAIITTQSAAQSLRQTSGERQSYNSNHRIASSHALSRLQGLIE